MSLVPVWDCTKHYVNVKPASDKTFNVMDMLSQSGRVQDERWEGEVPHGAFVAVLSTVGCYGDSKAEEKTISLNLAAVHVLAVHREE